MKNSKNQLWWHSDCRHASEKSGNIAEAALQLSGIFEKAQQAADIYLSSIKKTYEQKDKIISEAQSKAEKIINDAKRYAEEIKSQAESEK